MSDRGRVLARGRASEVLDLGDGRVLRRFLAEGGDPAREAAVMRHVQGHGYPVPAVLEVHADALVLELVDGPTMAEAAGADPATVAGHARTLAALHERLHGIEAPGGGTLLHLDLHPRNVLLSAAGPVVIDWTNARAGEAAVDPALTWVILMTSAGPTGRRFARHFETCVDVHSGLAEAVAYRLRDRNVTDAERADVQRLLD